MTVASPTTSLGCAYAQGKSSLIPVDNCEAREIFLQNAPLRSELPLDLLFER